MSVRARVGRFSRRRVVAIAASLTLLPTLVACSSSSESTSAASASSGSASATGAPDPAMAGNRTWTGTITTNRGPLQITLDGAKAPKAVASFIHLAQTGFFENTACHRLTTAAQGLSVLQCGDPTGTGTGGPGYEFGPVENAPADGSYPAGTLAMARRADDGMSNGSQFFIVYADTNLSTDAAGGYTVMGRVTSGLDVVQKVAAGGLAQNGVAPATSISLQKVTVK